MPRLQTLASLTASLMLGACSASTDLLPSIALAPESGKASKVASDTSAKAELQKATEYWGKQYDKNPSDLQTALNYAKDLKAQGDKQRAMEVLQQATVIHSDNKELASEYGRLALELNQIGPATQALAAADDPMKPDWRVISARGTAMAKQGHYGDAIPFFERALTVAPGNASVLNNLAMAHAAMGDPKKAEEILRQAMASNGATPKIRENLALVLGLQGRYDESRAVASSVLDSDTATSNTAYLKQLVKLDAKAPAAIPAFNTTITTSSIPRATPADTPAVWKTSVSSR